MEQEIFTPAAILSFLFDVDVSILADAPSSWTSMVISHDSLMVSSTENVAALLIPWPFGNGSCGFAAKSKDAPRNMIDEAAMKKRLFFNLFLLIRYSLSYVNRG